MDKNRVEGVDRRSLLQRSAGLAAATLATLGIGTQKVSAQTLSAPAAVQATQPSLYNATNTSFGTASTEGSYADCAVVFTAPETGRVLIHWSGGLRNLDVDGSASAYLSPEVRTGGTVGSGSVVLAATDARTVRANLAGTQTVRAGATHLLGGLTPGATYNALLLHRVTSNTGVFFQRGVIVAAAS